jgi:hypothetical protein
MGLTRFHELPETDNASRPLWPGTVNVIRNSRRAAAYRDGFDLMLAAWSGAEQAFDAAVEADPEFALALAHSRAHALRVVGRTGCQGQGTGRLNGTARERSHGDVLALGIEGQPAKSLERALAHLDKATTTSTAAARPQNRSTQGRNSTSHVQALRGCWTTCR